MTAWSTIWNWDEMMHKNRTLPYIDIQNIGGISMHACIAHSYSLVVWVFMHVQYFTFLFVGGISIWIYVLPIHIRRWHISMHSCIANCYAFIGGISMHACTRCNSIEKTCNIDTFNIWRCMMTVMLPSYWLHGIIHPHLEEDYYLTWRFPNKFVKSNIILCLYLFVQYKSLINAKTIPGENCEQ